MQLTKLRYGGVSVFSDNGVLYYIASMHHSRELAVAKNKSNKCDKEAKIIKYGK